jgi:hypothetical protein
MIHASVKIPNAAYISRHLRWCGKAQDSKRRNSLNPSDTCRIQGFEPEQLGRHEEWSADSLLLACQTEICHFTPKVCINHDICRLEIGMDDRRLSRMKKSHALFQRQRKGEISISVAACSLVEWLITDIVLDDSRLSSRRFKVTRSTIRVQKGVADAYHSDILQNCENEAHFERNRFIS